MRVNDWVKYRSGEYFLCGQIAEISTDANGWAKIKVNSKEFRCSELYPCSALDLVKGVENLFRIFYSTGGFRDITASELLYNNKIPAEVYYEKVEDTLEDLIKRVNEDSIDWIYFLDGEGMLRRKKVEYICPQTVAREYLGRLL